MFRDINLKSLPDVHLYCKLLFPHSLSVQIIEVVLSKGDSVFKKFVQKIMKQKLIMSFSLRSDYLLMLGKSVEMSKFLVYYFKKKFVILRKSLKQPGVYSGICPLMEGLNFVFIFKGGSPTSTRLGPETHQILQIQGGGG